jgi:potassium-transporting ATPase KdpC subunit
MFRQLLPALRMVVVLTILTGIGYPLLVTTLCRAVFPRQASGSLIKRNGQVVGSALIGQEAGSPKYFHSRPSAAGNNGYDPTSSTGSNLGPTSEKLVQRVHASIDSFRAENPDYKGPIPADLVTASGSGLDPDISPASAYAQSPRIAKLRGLSKAQVDKLIAAHIKPPVLGIIGDPTVNVLRLNLDLDTLAK